MPKDNKNNKRYSTEFKESVIKRMEDSNESITNISEELNIAKSTMYQWLRDKNKSKNQDAKSYNKKPLSKWKSEDKFHIVLETYTLTEEELGAYCRRKGLYVDDVKNWRNQCLNANTTILKDPQKIENDFKEEQKRTKSLEKELKRKEKALAETAALLVLRKKANAIWGDPEED
jgi:transposase-like protein